MKTIRLHLFLAATALAFLFGSCANDDIAQSTQTGGTGDTPTEEVTFEATPLTPTRTTMSNAGVFKWEAGDYIWVKDDTDAWRKSSNSPTEETAAFKFKVPGKFTSGRSYTVFYPGKNGTEDHVTIVGNQSQADPDKPSNIGTSGDCGWGTATSAPGKKQFNFMLNHKAAFLVFSPYSSNSIIQNSNDIKLTKIEVSSDDNLVGSFTLDPTTDQLTGVGSGKVINLTTTGGSTTPKGFSIPGTATPATNASYVIIKPGNHTLKVRFWLKDYVTNVEGTVTKEYPAFTYVANIYYAMPSELKVNNYSDKYYMWDAEQSYWQGHEWGRDGYIADQDQPIFNNKSGSNYPKDSSDPAHRWYNTTINGSGEANKNSIFKDCPNANQMSWYVEKGDPRWDEDEIWTTMGHLYKGGMWFKKADKIAAENSITTAEMKEKAADKSTDMRTHSNFSSGTPGNTPPTASELADYFYLPALGFYYGEGKLNSLGSNGSYWSSSAYPWGSDNAYCLSFSSAFVQATYNFRKSGFQAVPFK